MSLSARSSPAVCTTTLKSPRFTRATIALVGVAVPRAMRRALEAPKRTSIATPMSHGLRSSCLIPSSQYLGDALMLDQPPEQYGVDRSGVDRPNVTFINA